ncbi:MAG TPA: hypothetical protein VM939_09855 [Gemmatimonadaceae bacterium]|nr:hypothetical protein [Gemmatimonadaceae bacterium]
MTATSVIIPISQLFFDDAGPHVIRDGRVRRGPSAERYTPTRGLELQALLDASISQLGGVSGRPRRRTPARPAPVAIETLLYRGRAALDRALEIRTQVRAAGIAPQRETIDELLDLVELAAAE